MTMTTLTHEQCLAALAAWSGAMKALEASGAFESPHLAVIALGAISLSSLSDVVGVSLEVAQAGVMLQTHAFRVIAGAAPSNDA
jgi:hypothetical protein